MGVISLLVADDEELERRALKKIIQDMQEESFVLYEAENGKEVLERIQHTMIDILLLDIRMPGLDGIQIARQIRLLSPVTHIVFITAFSEFDYAREAIRLGVEEYLVKPVSRETVQGTLEKIVNQIREKQEERNSTVLAEGLLQEEVEAAFTRGDITNEKIEAYVNFKNINKSSRYLVAAELLPRQARSGDLRHSQNRMVKDYEANNARIHLLNSLVQSGFTALAGHIENTGRFYTMLFCNEEITQKKLQDTLALIVQEIRLRVGISVYFAAMEWKDGDIRNLMTGILQYLSLANDEFPVLVMNADLAANAEHAKGKIAKIVEYLRQHLAQDVSLEEAARVVGLSPYHVSHLFKAYQGETFVQVYTRLRISAAKQLLKDGRYSIKEICRMLGFKDQAYFSRVFTKKEGINPQTFQKLNSKE